MASAPAPERTPNLNPPPDGPIPVDEPARLSRTTAETQMSPQLRQSRPGAPTAPKRFFALKLPDEQIVIGEMKGAKC